MGKYTVLKLTGGDLGPSGVAMIRCDLAEASSPVEIDWCEGNGWESTQWQCASTRHTVAGLAEIAEILCGESIPAEDREGIEWEEVAHPEETIIHRYRLSGREYAEALLAEMRARGIDVAKLESAMADPAPDYDQVAEDAACLIADNDGAVVETDHDTFIHWNATEEA